MHPLFLFFLREHASSLINDNHRKTIIIDNKFNTFINFFNLPKY